MADAEPVENAVDGRVDLRLVISACLEPEGDIVAHDRQDDLVLRRLEDVADPSEHLGRVRGRIEPVDDDAARRRLDEAVDQPREGRLAGTVEADDTDALLLKRQAQREERGPCAKIDAGVVEADIQAAALFPGGIAVV